MSHFRNAVLNAHAGSLFITGFLLVVFPQFSERGIAIAQTCTHFLNATDGDDGSTGTSASGAVRTLEHAFLTFPSGAVVCMTAGEYFQGSDADGIQLSGPKAVDKSMTFVLQTFAGNNVVGITEDEFVLDIGSGSITFRAGSTSRLFFGEGTVNNNTDFPNHTNFLHTLRLVSGTLDVEAVDLVVGPSLGNPSFELNSKVAPESAAIVRNAGSISGSPQYQNAFRRIKYEGAGSRVAGGELPAAGRLELLFHHSEGTVSIPGSINMTSGIVSVAESGDVRFEANVTFLNAIDQSLSVEGDGTIYFKSISGSLSNDVDFLNVKSGRLEIERLELLNQTGSENVNALLLNDDRLYLRLISTPPNVDGGAVEVHATNRGTLSISTSSTPSPATVHIDNHASASLLIAGNRTHVGDISNQGKIELEGLLRLTGELLNTGNVFLVEGNSAETAVTLVGRLENPGVIDLGAFDLFLASGAEHLNDGEIANGTLVLSSNSTIVGGGILPAVHVLDGSSTIAADHVAGQISCTADAALHVAEGTRIGGGITAECNVSHAGPLTIGGSLELTGGTFHATDTIYVADRFFMDEESTLIVEDAVLVLAGDFIHEGGSLDVANGDIEFVGGRPQRLRLQADLAVRNLLIAREGTHVTSEATVVVAGNLELDERSILTLDAADVRIRGAHSTAEVKGLLRTDNGAALIFAGPASSQHLLAGGGLVGNVRIEMDVENDQLLVHNSGITVSGSVTIQRGGLSVASAASMILSSELDMPRVNRNLGDVNKSGGADGKGIVANVSGAGILLAPDGVDIGYYGGVVGSVTPGAELLTTDLRDLHVDFDPVADADASLRLTHSLAIPGSLHVGEYSRIDLNGHQLVSSGSRFDHSIDGTLGGGEFLIEGSGIVHGAAQHDLWIDHVTIRSAGQVELKPAGAVATVNLERGTLAIEGDQGAIHTYRQRGPEARLRLNSPIRILQEADLELGRVETQAFDILLADDAELSASSDVTWDENVSGHVVFIGSGAVQGNPSVLPRLKIAAGSAADTVRVSGAIRITSSLLHENGTLHLVEEPLVLSGRLWSVARGTYAGDGAIEIRGNLEATFESDVSVPALIIGTISEKTVFSVRSQNDAPVSLRTERMRLAGGTTNLANNDVRLFGNAPVLIAGGGTINMTSAQTPGPNENGEIVFESAGVIQLDESLSVPNLRLDGNVALAGAPATLSVTRQVAFGKGSITGSAGQLIFDHGIRIIRRGSGAPSITPIFKGLVDVIYDLGEASLPGALNTSAELPSDVRHFIVDAGMNTGNKAHMVRLMQNVQVHRSLRILSGTLDFDKSTISMLPASEVRIEYTREPKPAFSGDASYLTKGPISLSYEGVSGDLVSDDLTFPVNADVGSLVIRMGNPNSAIPRHFQLHAVRSVEKLLIDHTTAGSTFNLSGTTLIVDDAADIAAGRLTTESEGVLEVGGDFFVRDGAVADGVLSVHVAGTTTIEGAFRGHLLRAEGDVRIPGSLGGPDRDLDAESPNYVAGLPNLVLEGNDQILSLSSSDVTSSHAPDETVNRLTIAQDSSASISEGSALFVESLDGTPVVLGVNFLELVNGLISLGENVIALPTNGVGFSMPDDTDVSHIVGAVRRTVDAGQPNPFTRPVGRFTFPVGAAYPHAVFRPVSVIFDEEAPAAAAYSITVSHRDTIPGGFRGLPVNGGDDIVLDDTTPFHWLIESSPAFSPRQAFTLEFLATDFTLPTSIGRTRILRRSVDGSGSAWRLHADPSSYDNARVTSGELPSVFIRTRDVQDGLSSDTAIFSIGLERSVRDFARVQLVHDADAEDVSIAVDDRVVYENLAAGNATPFLRLDPGDRDLALIENGVDVIREPMAFEAGRDYIVVAAGRRNRLSRGFYVLPEARATPASNTDGNGLITLFNGYDTSLDVTFFRGTPEEASYFGVRPGGYINEYIEVSPDVLKFDVSSGDDAVSHRADLRSLSGLTAVIVVGAGLDEALVVSNEGERVRSYTAVSNEQDHEIPASFALHGNYPNPFNPTTNILFDLPESSSITVEVVDLLGRNVLTYSIDGVVAGSRQRVEIDASGLASGVYVYRLSARTATSTYSASGRFTVVK